MISIIIPAYNEEKVIGRCLSAITNGIDIDELEIIVVCNGCRDMTAEKARNFKEKIKVIELQEGSKPAALNAGDREAKFFPRFYIDADVVIDGKSIKKIVDMLSTGKYLLASPIAKNNLTASSMAVKSFYKIWHSLPYNKVMVGTGIYVLSEEGRTKFNDFPEIIADDAFVRTRFKPEERCSVEGAEVEVYAPQTFRDLINVKTRSRLGHYEMKKKFPNESAYDEKDFKAIILSLPFGLGTIWHVFIYIVLNFIVRLKAAAQLRKKDKYRWARDESTR